jgi:uncharacterized membrane protein
MTKDEENPRETLITSIRKNLFSGVLIAIPFVVSLLIIQWLFHGMASILQPIVGRVLPWLAKLLITTPVPDTYLRISVTTLSVILLVILLYFVGVIGRFVMGKRLISLGEKVFMKIPIVRTIYGSSKQVIKAMSLSDQMMFKSVVLVDFPKAGMKAIGFLTGFITDSKGKRYCKIIIPTSPNPTTGFFELVPEEETFTTNISVEDGFKMLISGGVVSPESFKYIEQNQNTSNGKEDKKHS